MLAIVCGVAVQQQVGNKMLPLAGEQVHAPRPRAKAKASQQTDPQRSVALHGTDSSPKTNLPPGGSLSPGTGLRDTLGRLAYPRPRINRCVVGCNTVRR